MKDPTYIEENVVYWNVKTVFTTAQKSGQAEEKDLGTRRWLGFIKAASVSDGGLTLLGWVEE